MAAIPSFFIKSIIVEFSGNFVGDAEIILVEPLLRKSTALAVSGQGITSWTAKDALEECKVFGPATIELNYSGRGDCHAFIEPKVEAKNDESK